MRKSNKMISFALALSLAATGLMTPTKISAKELNQAIVENVNYERLSDEELAELEKKIEASLNYRDDNLDISLVDNKYFPDKATGDVALEKYTSPYVTSIKNQNPYGTCWAHGALSASEASIKKNYGKTLDLSEWQLSYFTGPGGAVADPMGLTTGDSYSRGNSQLDYLDVGGNQVTVYTVLAAWKGTVDEDTYPATDYSIVQASRTAKLADDYAYKKNSYVLSDCNIVSYKDIDAVKKLIVDHGAVTGSYCSSTYYNTTNYWYTSAPVAEYCPLDINTNHAITVIGWDDNYSKNNFGTYKPTNNGAWLCKNSWGTGWSKDGLFYISYEDVPLLNSEAFSYDYMPATKYDYNYQYDGGAMCTYYGTNGANIYTSTGSQKLQAVGYFTGDSNQTVNIKVYTNVTAGKPTSGTLVTSKKVNAPMAGYHTVKLDKEVLLRKGTKFSVVVEYSTSDPNQSSYYLVPVDYSNDWGWCKNVSKVNAGESFIDFGYGSWSDMASYGYNCRIKAFTKNADASSFIDVTSITLDKTSATLAPNGIVALKATVLPTNATDKTVTWMSSNTAVATVDATGKVTAKAKGTATITCSSTDGSNISATCKITVEKPDGPQLIDINKCNITLSKNKFVYSGAAIKPSITIKDNTGKRLVKNVDYTTSFTNNVNIGTATVKIKGIGKYKGTVRKTYVINPKAPKITSIKNSVSKGFVVKWSKQKTVTGYQISYATKSNFSNEKKVTVKGINSIKKTIKKLKKGKTYYVRIRSVKNVGTKTYYSEWSSKSKVKIKK